MIETSQLRTKRTGMRRLKEGLLRWEQHRAALRCERQ